METKTTLIDIYNALTEVETKGRSTFIMTDCLRALKQIIDSNETKKTVNDNE